MGLVAAPHICTYVHLCPQGPAVLKMMHVDAAVMLMTPEAPDTYNAQRPLLERFSQACSALHRSWELRIWDVAAVEMLLQLRYPQALEMFHQYPTLFVQGKIVYDGLSPV